MCLGNSKEFIAVVCFCTGKEQVMKKNRQTIFSFIILVIMLGLIAIMVIDLIPILKQVLSDTHDETKMRDYVDAYGAKGVPILVGLQALQVMLTVIPAAAIQVLSGLCYGIWLGSLICIAGGIVGNMIVFIVLRQVRNTLTSLFKERGRQKDKQGGSGKHHFLSVSTLDRMKHPEYISFFFYLIPGIPNGILPYIFAQTHISIGRYLLSVAAANIPSVLLCTWLGERISSGDYKTAIILAAVFAFILVFVLIFRRKITDRVELITKKEGKS
jgi:uncharacterized membrane protein YdjX (TVP38/TMEM64 family)